MLNIKGFFYKKNGMLLCFWLLYFNHLLYLDIWRFYFFSPIFCDVAKVMIIPRKILAKYGYMLNFNFKKKTNMLLYLWLLYLNHVYLSGKKISPYFLGLIMAIEICQKYFEFQHFTFFNFPFWICIANHTQKRLESSINVFLGSIL